MLEGRRANRISMLVSRLAQDVKVSFTQEPLEQWSAVVIQISANCPQTTHSGQLVIAYI